MQKWSWDPPETRRQKWKEKTIKSLVKKLIDSTIDNIMSRSGAFYPPADNACDPLEKSGL
jgi:hypothetical protein